MPNLRKHLVRELLKIPGVIEETWAERDDGFSSLKTEGKEFAHFHNDNELDIRLTKRIISEHNLSHPRNSKNHPNRSRNSPWIELRFFEEIDIEEIVRLVNQLLVK